MKQSATLAGTRAELAAGNRHVVHASLSLYVIAENKPQPDCPEWIEVGCLKNDTVEGLMAYLSPLDALLDARLRNRIGGRYRVHPFEAIDPRAYIADHNSWLTLFIAYGFAACGKHLLTGRDGAILVLGSVQHFLITPAMSGRFHLHFPDKIVSELASIYRNARFDDYNHITNQLAECAIVELEREVEEAAARIGQTIMATDDNATHCALYDTIEQRWRFAAIAE